MHTEVPPQIARLVTGRDIRVAGAFSEMGEVNWTCITERRWGRGWLPTLKETGVREGVAGVPNCGR